MGNQGCTYLVMFGCRTWLNFGINPYHYFVLNCISIFMCACVVYLPWVARMASLRTVWHCTPLWLFCPFDQPESIFYAFAARHHRLARLCDTDPNSEPVSGFEANTLRNDPGFGCVVITSGMKTIWVHMALLVWSTICYQRKQAVVLI